MIFGLGLAVKPLLYDFFLFPTEFPYLSSSNPYPYMNFFNPVSQEHTKEIAIPTTVGMHVDALKSYQLYTRYQLLSVCVMDCII